MATETRSYGFHGMSVRDKLLMKSMIERAARRIEQVWLPAEAELADCIFYQGQLPEGLRADAERVYVGAHPDPNASRSMQYPPRVGEFVSVLAAVHQRLSSANQFGTQSLGSWQSLVVQVQASLARNQAVSLLDSSRSGWMLYPEQRQFVAVGPSERLPRDLPDSAAGQWQLSDKALPSTHTRQPLESLLWFLGIASGREGVLQDIGNAQPLRMRVWPYLLARAPRSFSGLAAQLRQEARSAIELQAKSNAPMEEVAAFVNACALCGFLSPAEVAKAPDAEQPRPNGAAASQARPAQRFTRFLGAIRVALGMPA